MASSSGRRGEFSPESKGLIGGGGALRGGEDVDRTELAVAAEKSFGGTTSRQPTLRRTSKTTTTTTRTSPTTAPEVCVLAPSGKQKKSAAAVDDVAPGGVVPFAFAGEGCKVCHRDTDHPNLLLCEACNDEYHTYCLNPPLQSVPEGDFFCDKCKRLHATKDDDGLDSLVSALPPSYTSRFGEIVWAAGGVGFGWWPACVYDPRLTVGGARQLARKNLGRRHLIYFFECNEAPFTVLGDNRLTPWDDGFVEEYDLGKVARSGGKNRVAHFERALDVARLEHGRPIELRMDWNHQESIVAAPPSRIAKPKSGEGVGGGAAGSTPASEPSRKKRRESPGSAGAKRSLSYASLPRDNNNNFVANRTNLNTAIDSLNDDVGRGAGGNKNGANAIEPSEDGILVCKILRRMPAGRALCTTATEGIEYSENLGFVALPSRQSATFAAVRRAVESDLDDDALPFSDEKMGGRRRWKFYVPKLGPMSVKQEGKMGPALEFLRSTTDDARLGNGTASNPLKVVIMDV